MIRLLLLILLIGLLSFCQAFGFLIFDVKPNLALVAVITASFFVANIWEEILLVALAALILKFAPGLEREILFFSLIGVAAAIIKNYLPWRYLLSNLVLIALATLIFYLLLAPNLILSSIFLKELLLNITVGIIAFAFLSVVWQNKKLA